MNVANDNNETKVINDSYDTNDLSPKTYMYSWPKAIAESL